MLMIYSDYCTDICRLIWWLRLSSACVDCA